MFNPIAVDTVVAKSGSSPSAFANSFSVSNTSGALSTNAAISESTYVVFAFKSIAACCNVETGLSISLVLSTLANPTSALTNTTIPLYPFTLPP